MTTKPAAKTFVFAGTRKGGFVFSSDEGRKEWQMSDIHFKGWNVMHMILDLRDRRLHTALVHDVYGPSTHFSDDIGSNWTQARISPVFLEASASGRPLTTPEEAKDPEQVKRYS